MNTGGGKAAGVETISRLFSMGCGMPLLSRQVEAADHRRVILALDGLQPDVGHEVLWVVRDCLSGTLLLARALLSASTVDLAALLREVVTALPVPVAGVISDGQHAIRLAVQQVLPDVPHQLCQFPYQERRSTGRKVTSASLVARGGVRVVAATVTRLRRFAAADLVPTDHERWRHIRQSLAHRPRPASCAIASGATPPAFSPNWSGKPARRLCHPKKRGRPPLTCYTFEEHRLEREQWQSEAFHRLS